MRNSVLAGQYQGEEGQAECIVCDEGKYSENDGAKECVDCPAGWFQGEKGQAKCLPCSSFEPNNGYSSDFFYAPSEGMDKCVFCPAGHYTSGGDGVETRTECDICQEGKKCSGNSVVEDCEIGNTRIRKAKIRANFVKKQTCTQTKKVK